MATWVLLRGLMRDKRHWQDFGERLKRLGIMVISMDTLGNGELNRLTSPYSMAEYAKDMLERLDTDESYYLIGLSMGGMIALEMARLAPDRIKAVALLNSSAADLSPWYHRCRVSGVYRAIKTRLRGRELNWVESSIVNLSTFSQGNNYRLVHSWSLYRQGAKTSMANAFRQLMACAKFHCPSLSSTPVLVLSGAKDVLVDNLCSERLARKYLAPMVKLPLSGHDIALDSPERLAKELRDFFADID